MSDLTDVVFDELVDFDEAEYDRVKAVVDAVLPAPPLTPVTPLPNDAGHPKGDT